MTAFEEIERARALPLVNEDGDPVDLAPGPPLSDAEIGALQQRVGVTLPTELTELLQRCGGLDGVLDGLDFSGRTINDFDFGEVFPHPLGIAQDGFGNFWVLDLSSAPRDRAPVYFVCHDAPVVLYQSPDLTHFVHEVVRMYIPPHRSAIDDVHEDRLFQVWRRNPGAVTRRQAQASEDSVLKRFAEELDDRFIVVDLRDAEIGMGFSWGRHGTRTVLRRHGEQPIFAYARP